MFSLLLISNMFFWFLLQLQANEFGGGDQCIAALCPGPRAPAARSPHQALDLWFFQRHPRAAASGHRHTGLLVLLCCIGES